MSVFSQDIEMDFRATADDCSGRFAKTVGAQPSGWGRSVSSLQAQGYAGCPQGCSATSVPKVAENLPKTCFFHEPPATGRHTNVDGSC